MTIDKSRLVAMVHEALYASKIISYTQGLDLLRTMGEKKAWGLGTAGGIAHHGVADVVGGHAQDAIAKRITPARGMMPYGPMPVPPRIQPRLPSPQPAALPAPA